MTKTSTLQLTDDRLMEVALRFVRHQAEPKFNWIKDAQEQIGTVKSFKMLRTTFTTLYAAIDAFKALSQQLDQPTATLLMQYIDLTTQIKQAAKEALHKVELEKNELVRNADKYDNLIDALNATINLDYNEFMSLSKDKKREKIADLVENPTTINNIAITTNTQDILSNKVLQHNTETFITDRILQNIDRIDSEEKFNGYFESLLDMAFDKAFSEGNDVFQKLFVDNEAKTIFMKEIVPNALTRYFKQYGSKIYEAVLTRFQEEKDA